MNYGKTVKAWSAGLIFSVATSFASAGPIATMTLDFQDDAANGGFPEGSRTGQISGVDGRVRAGMFRFAVAEANFSDSAPFQLSTNDVLDAFCVDINTYLAYGPTQYSLVRADDYFDDPDSTVVNRIGQLYSGYNKVINTPDNSAAFQLALWEIINETGADLSLSGNQQGSFAASEFGSALGLANEWLEKLDDFDNDYNLFVLKSGSDGDHKLSQDLLVYSPAPVKVPEPGTLALLALGICGLLLRKKSGRTKE
jgi:PEP-CTERM motif